MSGVSMVTLPCIHQPCVLRYFTFFPLALWALSFWMPAVRMRCRFVAKQRHRCFLIAF